MNPKDDLTLFYLFESEKSLRCEDPDCPAYGRFLVNSNVGLCCPMSIGKIDFITKKVIERVN